MTLLIMLKKIFLFITLTGALSAFTSFENVTQKQQQTPVLKTIIIDVRNAHNTKKSNIRKTMIRIEEGKFS